MNKRTAILATTGLSAALALALAGPAWAFWDAGSTGAKGYVAVDALGTPTVTSIVSANRRSVTFTVTGTTPGAPTGYRVDRPGSGGTACTITGPATSCVYPDPTNPPSTTRVESGDYKVYALLGNNWQSPIPAVVAIDTVDPTVLSFVAAPGQPNPSAGNEYDFVATFSEPVEGLISGDLTFLTPVGITPAPVITVTAQSTTVYLVHVTGVTTDGNVQVRIPLAVAADGAGNTNEARSSATVKRVTLPPAPLASSARVAPEPAAPAESAPASPDRAGPVVPPKNAAPGSQQPAQGPTEEAPTGDALTGDAPTQNSPTGDAPTGAPLTSTEPPAMPAPEGGP